MCSSAKSRRFVEDVVRSSLASGDPGRALTATLAAYAAEVYGFLRVVMPRGQDARRIYGRTIEVLQEELVAFPWDTELRVLVYTVARQQARRARAGRSAISTAHGYPLLPEDLELLVLRLDRELSWRQIAYTSLGSGTAEDRLLAEADRLHARFVAVRREVGGER